MTTYRKRERHCRTALTRRCGRGLTAHLDAGGRGSSPPARRHARSSRSKSVPHTANPGNATALDPPQSSWPFEVGQIAEVDRHLILRLGACAAHPARRPACRRLDRCRYLDVVLNDLQRGTRAAPTAPRPDRRRRSSSRVSSTSQPTDSRNDGQTPDPRGGCSASPVATPTRRAC